MQELCDSCYSHYRRHSTLERRHKRVVKPRHKEKKRCSFSDCMKPDDSDRFHSITPEKFGVGLVRGQDWKSVVGQVHTLVCKHAHTYARSHPSIHLWVTPHVHYLADCIAHKTAHLCSFLRTHTRAPSRAYAHTHARAHVSTHPRTHVGITCIHQRRFDRMRAQWVQDRERAGHDAVGVQGYVHTNA